MPVSERHREVMVRCRMERYRQRDKFSHLRLEPDLETYLAVADQYLDDQWPCAGCGRLPTPAHPHYPKHIRPPSFGGADEEDNLLPLCSRCHKAAMEEDEARMRWVNKPGRLLEVKGVLES